jgi:pimeloyl-ACP methyl ester carboxylesterase
MSKRGDRLRPKVAKERKETSMDIVTSEDGTSIAFDRAGQGPALILVGGAFQHRASDSHTARLAELLAPGLTVYHYDRRGRGDSGDTAPYAVEREIEDLDALIQDAGGSAFVFGMSSGAVLAVDAAARGRAVAKLALYEPPFIVDDSRAPLPPGYTEQLTELLASGRRGDAVELFMTEAVGLPAEAVTPMRGAPFWSTFEDVAHTLRYDNAIMQDRVSGNPLPADRWASVTMPTIVMDGDASPTWARNAVQALVEVLPNAERRTLEGQTHQVDPEVLAPVLREFFAR